MDDSQYPSLPNLALLHAQLARDSRRVEKLVDSQLDEIERLFSAATTEDWEAVARATRSLADLTPDQIGEEVLYTARQLSREIRRSKSHSKKPKHLTSLLNACRAERRRRTQ